MWRIAALVPKDLLADAVDAALEASSTRSGIFPEARLIRIKPIVSTVYERRRIRHDYIRAGEESLFPAFRIERLQGCRRRYVHVVHV